MLLRARIYFTVCREPRIWGRTGQNRGIFPGGGGTQGMPLTHLCAFAACWSHWSRWPLCEKPHEPVFRHLPSLCQGTAQTSQIRCAPHTLPSPKTLPSAGYLLELQPALCHRNYPEGQAESI